MHSSGFFRIKPIARLILKREILGSHTISDQSLLLSTNDVVKPYDTPVHKGTHENSGIAITLPDHIEQLHV